jgi:uncharacterized protein (TIGR03435 family)
LTPEPGRSESDPAAEASVLSGVQDQFGLKLVPGKAQVEALVIDSVEKPSEN